MGAMLTMAEVAADLDAVIARVQAGEEIVVLQDGAPVARLTPIAAAPAVALGDLASRHDWSRYDLSPEALTLPEGDWDDWREHWAVGPDART
jgi:antitoxin (DNA-binding transcriptional repressor) of toxin-antitoxin stability system